MYGLIKGHMCAFVLLKFGGVGIYELRVAFIKNKIYFINNLIKYAWRVIIMNYGNYGEFGGQYVPKEIKDKLEYVSKEFNSAIKDEKFIEEYNYYLRQYIGRPSPLYYAKNFTKYCDGAKIYLKREDLNHTGAHKINNAIGQALLARRMGLKHIIAETGAGQHGVATATVCSLLNLQCTIFMGVEDVRRQHVNVEKMNLLGASVCSVTRGNGTLKEAVDEALEYFVNNQETFYLIGSAVGPSPYPEMVKYFQKVIGEEARRQVLEQENKLPQAIIACVGGGSNSIGLFSSFLEESDIDIYGVEGAGLGLTTGKHASAIANNKIGILHGMKTYMMQDDEGNVKDAYSISAGLDYPGIGPEHAYLHKTERVFYDAVTDSEAVEAFKLLTKLEGIIPALESSHAIAYVIKIAKKYKKDDVIIVILSGRGDKDLNTILNL